MDGRELAATTSGAAAAAAPPAVASWIRSNIWAATAVVLLVAAFLAPWWNRYFGGTLEGYFPYYGSELNRGQVPYRDFYLHLPPLLPIESALVERWTSHPLIALRAIGGIERILLAFALFAWLRQLVRASLAAVATVFAVVLASTGDTEVLHLYNHQSILWAVLAGLLATLDFERPRPRAWPLLLSGVASSLALLCKQTTGLGAFLAVGIGLGVAWLGLRDRSAALRGLGLWSLGAAVPLGLCALWLIWQGALAAALQQIFLDGSASRGPLPDLASRAFEEPWRVAAFRVPAILAIAAVLLGLRAMRRGIRHPMPEFGFRAQSGNRTLGIVAALGLGAIALGVATAPRLHLGDGWLLLPERWAALFSLWGSVAALIVVSRTLLDREMTPRLARVGLFAGVSLALAYMLSLSWAVQPAMALPGLALLAALVVEGIDRSRQTVPARFQLPRVFVGLLALALLFATWERQLLPFNFAGWKEPPLFAPRAAHAPHGLEGYNVSAETAAFVDQVVSEVRDDSGPADRVLAFSQVPFILLLAERESATSAVLHWFDVTPDRVCRHDLRELDMDPPRMMVLWPMTSAEITEHEREFRSGHASGQRELWREVRQLAHEQYRLSGEFEAPGGTKVDVWSRKDLPRRDTPTDQNAEHRADLHHRSG